MSELSSGKGHRDENFPVASLVLKRKYRAPILTFYRFARAADDIADHALASEAEKLRLLNEMRAGLEGNGASEAMALAQIARAKGLDLVHAHDLLDAFTQDVTQRRYRDWEELMSYCRLSAMPVGRFVLDVHGEDRATWPLSDALCAALQVINHLQDCAKDFRQLDRVYIPLDALAAEGVGVEALAEPRASPALRRVISELAEKTQDLLADSAPFAAAIRDARLAGEVAVIQALAEDLTSLLLRRDPLSEPVHHSKLRMGGLAMTSLLRHGARRAFA
jgi:squalene synthase HpnC